MSEPLTQSPRTQLLSKICCHPALCLRDRPESLVFSGWEKACCEQFLRNEMGLESDGVSLSWSEYFQSHNSLRATALWFCSPHLQLNRYSDYSRCRTVAMSVWWGSTFPEKDIVQARIHNKTKAGPEQEARQHLLSSAQCSGLGSIKFLVPEAAVSQQRHSNDISLLLKTCPKASKVFSPKLCFVFWGLAASHALRVCWDQRNLFMLLRIRVPDRTPGRSRDFFSRACRDRIGGMDSS